MPPDSTVDERKKSAESGGALPSGAAAYRRLRMGDAAEILLTINLLAVYLGVPKGERPAFRQMVLNSVTRDRRGNTVSAKVKSHSDLTMTRLQAVDEALQEVDFSDPALSDDGRVRLANSVMDTRRSLRKRGVEVNSTDTSREAQRILKAEYRERKKAQPEP
jgi:hypothetical protein